MFFYRRVGNGIDIYLKLGQKKKVGNGDHMFEDQYLKLGDA